MRFKRFKWLFNIFRTNTLYNNGNVTCDRIKIHLLAPSSVHLVYRLKLLTRISQPAGMQLTAIIEGFQLVLNRARVNKLGMVIEFAVAG